MKKYCDLCEPNELGAICHASNNEECPDNVYCDAEQDIHGVWLDEMEEDEYLRYGY